MPTRLLVMFAAVCLASILTQPTLAADEAPTLAKQTRWVTSATFIDGGAKLVTGGGESLLYRPGDVFLWDVKSGAQLAALAGQPTIVWSVAPRDASS